MSHALSIYVKPKNKEVEPIYLFYYTGGSDVYQLFRDNGKDFFCGNNDKPLYTELTKEILQDLMSDLNNDIKNVDITIETAKECKNITSEIFEELVSSKKYKQELEDTKKDIEFLLHLVEECNWNDNIIMYNSY